MRCFSKLFAATICCLFLFLPLFCMKKDYEKEAKMKGDYHGNTPLHLYVTEKLNELKYLIRAYPVSKLKKDIDKHNSDGQHPIFKLAREWNLSVLEKRKKFDEPDIINGLGRLIDAGADVNTITMRPHLSATSGVYGATVLSEVALHPNIVKFLIRKKGACPNIRQPGKMPLVRAVENDSIEAATTLLLCGADPNVFRRRVQDVYEDVPVLHLSIQNKRNPAMTKLLLDFNANPNDGISLCSCLNESNVEAALLLAAYGADAKRVSNHIRYKGFSFIRYFSEYKKKNNIRHSLEHWAHEARYIMALFYDIYSSGKVFKMEKGDYSEPTLMSGKWMKEVVKSAVSLIWDIEKKEDLYACSAQEVVTLVKEKNSDPNQRSTVAGLTALHWAVIYLDVEKVKILLKYKANPYKECRCGISPYLMIEQLIDFLQKPWPQLHEKAKMIKQLFLKN